MGELVAEGKLDPQDVSLRFVGPCEYAGNTPVAKLIADNNLDGTAEIVGTLPRPEALKEIQVFG